ncbi:MAG TPA: XdhC family protein [Hyphomicrobiaceae bacterium]|nr:XdhC family protein [Hyphomicrobiaceae bacterium]
MAGTCEITVSPAEHDVLGAAREWLARDGRVALATVIDTWGSAPVPVGGQLAIAADGSFAGSVSGGCIEGEVITEAEEILAGGKLKTLEFGVADETAWRVGLPCGGRVKILLERLDRDGGLAILDRALAARDGRRGLVMKTRLADGLRQVFERDDSDLPADVAARFRTGKSSLQETPDGPVFIHALIPPARIVAIGATHIAQLLAQIARLTGYEIVVVDPRTAFATPERFPGVRVEADWPEAALARLGLDPYTALAVLAHVSHIDDEALKVALRSDCLYIGALGSSRNHAKRLDRLKAAGFTEAELKRIKSPIGIEIGAQSPAEIALAVMAEIVHAVRGDKPKKVAAAA